MTAPEMCGRKLGVLLKRRSALFDGQLAVVFFRFWRVVADFLTVSGYMTFADGAG